MAEAAIAQAWLVRGEVEGKMAELKQHAEVSALTTTNVLASWIEQVVAESSGVASRIATDVTQQLQKGLEAVVTSMAVNAEETT